jgi:cytochrome c oxidase cbb3-type subunit 2
VHGVFNPWFYARGVPLTYQIDPRSVVPESVMPPYAFLAEHQLDPRGIADHLRTNRTVGVPYSDEMIENAAADLRAQADPDGDYAALLARYPKAAVGDFDGQPHRLSEMDALVAYLQILGRMVDFGAAGIGAE